MKILKTLECGMAIKAAAAATLTLLLAGCSGFSATLSAPATARGAAFHGSLFGGRQPVSGARYVLCRQHRRLQRGDSQHPHHDGAD